MNPIAAEAERTLREHPHPALRLSELVALVAERLDRTLDGPRLRAALEAYPERFRILDPARGPWRPLPGRGERPLRLDVWVVSVTEPEGPPRDARATALKLRESVRWLGRGVDPRSAHEVSRWYALALAERALRESVARRAA